MSEVLVWLEEHEPREGRNYWLRGHRARALAALGRFDEARPILAENRIAVTERGGGLQLASLLGLNSSSRAVHRAVTGIRRAAASLSWRWSRQTDPR